ncbi:MAG: hypothetical protein PUP91_13725 [Rhizonema sp. PD37]|nr:hypothetical protein [Rhizonema sp. PD37]
MTLQTMFAAIAQRYQEAADRHSEMQRKYPRVEVEESYAIADFSIPAIKVTQGVATVDNGGRIVEEVRDDYFLSLSQVGQSLGMPQCRFDHAWRRHYKKVGDWQMKHRREWNRTFYKSLSLYIHKVMNFSPMIEDLAPRRPYYPSLDAVYSELFPGDHLGRRRKI